MVVLRNVPERTIFKIAIAVLVFTCITKAADAQVVNPADKQTQPSAPSGQAAEHVPTWRMPAINVYGEAPNVEEERIGDYLQPRWTAHRRFGETRVYVVPKGMIEFEYWLIPKDALRPVASPTVNPLEVVIQPRQGEANHK